MEWAFHTYVAVRWWNCTRCVSCSTCWILLLAGQEDSFLELSYKVTDGSQANFSYLQRSTSNKYENVTQRVAPHVTCRKSATSGFSCRARDPPFALSAVLFKRYDGWGPKQIVAVKCEVRCTLSWEGSMPACSKVLSPMAPWDPLAHAYPCQRTLQRTWLAGDVFRGWVRKPFPDLQGPFFSV